MVHIYPMTDWTGEGWESEVWMRLDGVNEPIHIANQYPFESEDEAYEAAREVCNQLANEIEKMAKTFNRDFRQDPREDKSNTYFVVLSEYIGPDTSDHADDSDIAIYDYCHKTNQSHEEREEGWLGQSGEYTRYAIGGYETLEEAEAAVQEECAEGFREYPAPPDCGIIKFYRLGKYVPMDRYGTETWCIDDICQEITHETTDEEIRKMFDEMDAEAHEVAKDDHGYGYELHFGTFMHMAEDRRNDLIEAMQE